MSQTMKIDKNHGFMKGIVRNQISRDNYDKQVAAGRLKTKDKFIKEEEPDLTIVGASQIKEEKIPVPLFKLEFTGANGEVKGLIIYKEDNPREVAQSLGRQEGLAPTLIQALFVRLSEEKLKLTKAA